MSKFGALGTFSLVAPTLNFRNFMWKLLSDIFNILRTIGTNL
jgi:hypothetical protein